MTDKPGDRSEERRRTGPLGDDSDDDATRVQPTGEQQEAQSRESQRTRETDQDQTRQIQTDRTGEGTSEQSDSDDERRSSRFRRSSRRRKDEDPEDKETRVIRTPGSAGGSATAQDSPYPRGYFEAAEEREDRLRDMYGGVDWLASFLGFVFTLVVGVFLAAILAVILVPLGISLTPSSGATLGVAAITGLVVLGILIFLTYFFGGYVSGRLARFDGGRNGAMLLLWSLLGAALLVLAGGILSGVLPGNVSDSIRNFLQETVLPSIGEVLAIGIIGIVILVAALLIALLGGFLGGRAGSRYHTEIDRTT